YGIASEGAGQQVVIAGADDLNLDEIATPILRRVAFGQVYAGINVWSLGCQPGAEHQFVIGGGSVHHHPGALAHAALEVTLDESLLERHHLPSPSGLD